MLADYQCHTGENPLWHADHQCLYWTDIPAGKLFRYFPATGKHEQVYSGRPVGGFTFQADGSLLLFMDRGTVAVWDGTKITRTVIDEIPDEADSRFNDVSADPEGRVFCGTMSVKDAQGGYVRKGKLHLLDTDGTLETVFEGVGTSNGMGFTPDLGGFYHTDTGTKQISRYDYERSTGGVSNKRLFVQVGGPDDGDGKCDGMTVDAAGDIWCGHWDGWCVVHYGQDGGIKRRIRMPVARCSSVAFGGPNLDELYVTTAGGHERGKAGETAGALYRITGLGVSGVAEFASRVGL